jgi:NADH-quinone oxidoreductase subunit L
VFEGKDNLDHQVAHHVHESPPTMAYPLLILGIGSLLVGVLFGFPPDHGLYHRFVEPVFAAAGTEAHAISLGTTVGLAAVATAIAALGIWGLARSWYQSGDSPAPERLAARYPTAYRVLLHKYYVDELYDALFVEPIRRLAVWLWRRFDEPVVDGSVNGVGALVRAGSAVLRRLQTGYVMSYVLSFVVGVVAILGYLSFRR